MHQIETTCFTLPWTLEQCRASLCQKAFYAWGLWQGDALCAYVSFYRHTDELEILNLAVLPDQRRKGYAARILAALLQAAAKMGMQKAVLEVRESNIGAISLYEKHGFRLEGIRAGYYPDNAENALIYTFVF